MKVGDQLLARAGAVTWQREDGWWHIVTEVSDRGFRTNSCGDYYDWSEHDATNLFYREDEPLTIG